MKRNLLNAITFIFLLLIVSCNGPKEEIRQTDDGMQILITADSIAAVITSAECTLIRSFTAKGDSGTVEYNIIVRKNPSDKFGLSYRINESNKAFAIYNNNDFKLIYPDFKMAMVPDSNANPANYAETYRKILAPIIKMAPQKDVIKAAKSIQYIGLEDFNGDMCHVVSVKDTLNNEAMALDYYISRETGMLKKLISERVSLTDKSVRHDLIVLKNMRINTEPADSLFIFNIPGDFKIKYIGSAGDKNGVQQPK